MHGLRNGWKKRKGLFLLAIAVVALVGATFVIYISKPPITPLGEEETIKLARKCVAEHWGVREETLEPLSAELLPTEEGPFPAEDLWKLPDKVWAVEFVLEEPPSFTIIYHLDNTVENVEVQVTQSGVWLDAYTGVRLGPVSSRYREICRELKPDVEI